jgi:hypothetical protein
MRRAPPLCHDGGEGNDATRTSRSKWHAHDRSESIGEVAEPVHHVCLLAETGREVAQNAVIRTMADHIEINIGLRRYLPAKIVKGHQEIRSENIRLMLYLSVFGVRRL